MVHIDQSESNCVVIAEMASSQRGALPPSFRCPISSEIMLDPVIVVGSSQTAGRDSVVRWFSIGHTRCPVSNVELQSPFMIPNHALTTAIQEWRASRGKEIPTAFICPLSGQPMSDPVTIMESRQTISRASALKWTKSGNLRCPVTGKLLYNCTYIPNYAVKSAFEEWQGILEGRNDDTSPVCDTVEDVLQVDADPNMSYSALFITPGIPTSQSA